MNSRLLLVLVVVAVCALAATPAAAQNYCGHHDQGCQNTSYNSCWQSHQSDCNSCKYDCQANGEGDAESVGECVERCQNWYNQDQQACWEQSCFFW